jgi:hypothetical protein
VQIEQDPIYNLFLLNSDLVKWRLLLCYLKIEQGCIGDCCSATLRLSKAALEIVALAFCLATQTVSWVTHMMVTMAAPVPVVE